jgi:hypothetical protein
MSRQVFDNISGGFLGTPGRVPVVQHGHRLAVQFTRVIAEHPLESRIGIHDGRVLHPNENDPFKEVLDDLSKELQVFPPTLK